MGYPEPYIEYLVYFHGVRDYFECHEVLEEYWKEEGMTRNHYLVGLIQIAVSLYHHRRDNFSGAMKTMNHAIKNLEQNKRELQTLGINSDELLDILKEGLTRIKQLQPYVSINLPINDPSLLKICEIRCQQQKCLFGAKSDMTNIYLIDKHKLRDRTPIIEERRMRLNKKGK